MNQEAVVSPTIGTEGVDYGRGDTAEGIIPSTYVSSVSRRSVQFACGFYLPFALHPVAAERMVPSAAPSF